MRSRGTHGPAREEVDVDGNIVVDDDGVGLMSLGKSAGNGGGWPLMVADKGWSAQVNERGVKSKSNASAKGSVSSSSGKAVLPDKGGSVAVGEWDRAGVDGPSVKLALCYTVLVRRRLVPGRWYSQCPTGRVCRTIGERCPGLQSVSDVRSSAQHWQLTVGTAGNVGRWSLLGQGASSFALACLCPT